MKASVFGSPCPRSLHALSARKSWVWFRTNHFSSELAVLVGFACPLQDELHTIPFAWIEAITQYLYFQVSTPWWTPWWHTNAALEESTVEPDNKSMQNVFHLLRKFCLLKSGVDVT